MADKNPQTRKPAAKNKKPKREPIRNLVKAFGDVIQEELSGLSVPRLTDVASAILALATVVVVAGGAVLWIRVNHAGLPEADSLAAMPRELFISTGAGEMFAPTLLFIAIYAVSRLIGIMAAKRKKGPVSHDSQEVVVDSFYGLAFAFLFFFPFNWRSIWIVATLILYVYLIDRDIAPSFGTFLIIAAIIAAGRTVALELDAPVKLRQTTVELRQGEPVHGLFVGETSSAVSLGVNGDLVTIPQTRVAKVTVGDPPHAEKHEPKSIVDRVLGLLGTVLSAIWNFLTGLIP